MWHLDLITAPTEEPLSWDDMESHARLDEPSAQERAWLDRAIATARQHFETHTGRAALTQTWDLVLDGFPHEIKIPLPPLQSVTSITYIDAAGDPQTLASSGYTARIPAGYSVAGSVPMHGRIAPAYGLSWPSTRDVPGAVTVRFVAGWSAAAVMPAPALQGMLMLAAELYAHREISIVGASVTPVRLGAEGLWSPLVAEWVI